MNKATAVAPSNIAFVKYWGKKDEVLRLPENGSLSMNLSNLTTTTTVEFSQTFTQDDVTIDGVQDSGEAGRVTKHLDRIRLLAQSQMRAKVVSQNSFPSKRGLSSSASGFAALTVAAAGALQLSLSEKELSILARQGSGSACRSIPNGFVEWVDGDTSDSSYGVSLYPKDYWDLRDIVVITGKDKKEIPTKEGMERASSSKFFPLRLGTIQEKLTQAKQFLSNKDFTAFGELIELEALEMHAIMISSNPPLLYWTVGTLIIMKQVHQWRKEGIEVYFTINTGQDVHLICQADTESAVMAKLHQLEGIVDILVSQPADGAHLTDTHLFI